VDTALDLRQRARGSTHGRLIDLARCARISSVSSPPIPWLLPLATAIAVSHNDIAKR
jgi:hypothetical protein